MWDSDVKYRSASGRTVDLHPPAQFLDTVFEPDEPGALSRVGTADAVVGDGQAKAVDAIAHQQPPSSASKGAQHRGLCGNPTPSVWLEGPDDVLMATCRSCRACAEPSPCLVQRWSMPDPCLAGRFA